MVGCVLVQDDRVVGQGWHREFGGPHAEIVALREAGEEAVGATAYVSLEPCDHRGKTPPCSEALVEARVARVVFGASDPGGASSGGAEALRSAGVEVVGPLLEPSEARQDNPAFFHRARRGTPWVALKLAMSLDGGIAAGPGERSAITGPEANKEVHRLRAGFRGILVGSGTVEVDDPLLTVRRGPAPRVPPTRIVLDSQARTSPDAALFRDAERVPVTIFTTPAAPDRSVQGLREAGATVHRVPGGPDGVDLDAVFDRLETDDVERVLCEGGGVLGTSLLRAGRVHRLYLFVAPILLGSGAVPAFPSPPPPPILEGWRTLECRGPVGRDALLVLEPAPGASGAPRGPG